MTFLVWGGFWGVAFPPRATERCNARVGSCRNAALPEIRATSSCPFFLGFWGLPWYIFGIFPWLFCCFPVFSEDFVGSAGTEMPC